MEPLEIVVLDSLEPWDATARNKALQALSGAPVVAREGGGRSTASELVSPRRLEPRRAVSASIGRNLEDLVVAYIASVGQELLRERVCQTLALIQGPPPETGAHALCQDCASSTLVYSDPLLLHRSVT